MLQWHSSTREPASSGDLASLPFPHPTGPSLAVLLALTTAAGAGVHDRLLLPERAVLEGETFELAFTGEWSYFFPAADPSPVVTVEGSTIRVVAGAESFPILPPPESYAFTAVVPPLPPGVWTVEMIPEANAGPWLTGEVVGRPSEAIADTDAFVCSAP